MLNIFITLASLWVFCDAGAIPSSSTRTAQELFRRGTATDECGDYLIVSARGTAEPQTGGQLEYAGFISGLMAAVPNGKNYEVVYPAMADFMRGPVQGATDALNYLKRSNCPNRKLVWLGYSQGAMVVAKALADSSVQPTNVACVGVYGNPYWYAKAPQNIGTATTGLGLSALIGKIPQAYRNKAKTQDICNAGDIVCTGRGSMAVHMSYGGSTYEANAVKWCASNL